MSEASDHWAEVSPANLSPGDDIRGEEFCGMAFYGVLRSKPYMLNDQRYPDRIGAWLFHLEETSGLVIDVTTKSPIEKWESHRLST